MFLLHSLPMDRNKFLIIMIIRLVKADRQAKATSLNRWKEGRFKRTISPEPNKSIDYRD